MDCEGLQPCSLAREKLRREQCSQRKGHHLVLPTVASIAGARALHAVGQIKNESTLTVLPTTDSAGELAQLSTRRAQEAWHKLDASQINQIPLYLTGPFHGMRHGGHGAAPSAIKRRPETAAACIEGH